MAFDKTPLAEGVSKPTLSEEIAKYVLNSYSVKNALKNGKSEKEMSILKWKKIYEAVLYFSAKDYLSFRVFINQWPAYLGYETCALCLKSIDRLLREKGEISSKGEKCSVCQLKPIDACIEHESTYKKLEEHFKTPFTASQKEEYTRRLLSLLQQMMDNLNRAFS